MRPDTFRALRGRSRDGVGVALGLIHETWHLKAACRGPESALFFPPSTPERRDEREAREAHAKHICAQCGVRDDCLEFAIAGARAARHLGRSHRGRTARACSPTTTCSRRSRNRRSAPGLGAKRHVDCMDESRRSSSRTPVLRPQAPRAAIRDAATVILVSDRPDLHVLDAGAHAPGGVRARRHGVPRRGGRCRPTAPGARTRGSSVSTIAAASAAQGIARGGLAFRVAAVRECFEEAGILLARDAGDRHPVEHDDGARGGARPSSTPATLAFGDLLETRALVLDARELRAVLALAHAARRAAPLQHLVLRRARARRRRRRARRQRARRVGVGAPRRRARAARRRRAST